MERDTDKARFFLPSEGRRDVYPADYKTADELAIAREQRERQRTHEVTRSLKTACVACGEEVPAHHPDYLVTDSQTGQRAVAHVECREVADAPGGFWKLRHCVGGLEVEELSTPLGENPQRSMKGGVN